MSENSGFAVEDAPGRPARLDPGSTSVRIPAEIEIPAQKPLAKAPLAPYRAPRLIDIAEAAGVHVSTVSRVLNEDPSQSVRPETSERIWRSARQLGYRPNALARGLKCRRTGALAFFIPPLRSPAWTRLQSGVLRRADERGYVVMIMEGLADGPETTESYSRLVEESRMDGLLLAASLWPRKSIGMIDGMPHVYVNNRGAADGNNVIMDESAAIRIFADHVSSLGHRSAALIDGPAEADEVRRRVAAFRRILTARGISVVARLATPTEEGGWDSVTRIMRRPSLPTAWAVGGLRQLLGMLAALRAADIDVPADMSVVSLEDHEWLTFLDVPITSVCMPLAELGSAAVDALIARIDGLPASDVMIRHLARLLERDSTAPPSRQCR